MEVLTSLIRDVEVLDIKDMHSNGMSIVDIALKTGYSEKTVRKWLRSDQPPRYRRPKRPSKLDPYKDYIMRRMGEGVFNCEILFRELQDKGYPGGRTILKDFVAPFRAQFKVQAVRRFETKPGEQAQMDWGYLGEFQLDGRRRKVWCFTLVLGYSRLLSAHCTTSMDLETVLLGHQKCFEQAGGVTRHIVYDNMKTVTIGRDSRNRPVWQSRFSEFALYYGFKPRAHRPYHPQGKGKVERSVGYIKQNFCPGRRFEDLTDLNRQLSHWVNRVANRRIHGTTGERPVDRVQGESLRMLPERSFDTHIRFKRKVSRDGYVSYLGVLYSVPWAYCGGQVHVEERIDSELVFWWHGRQIATHTMARDGTRRVSNPDHETGLIEAQRQNRASGLTQCYPEVQKRSLEVYERWAGTDS